ncbi:MULTISPECIES: hypothetical protein, partial [unclassified Pseudomonas]
AEALSLTELNDGALFDAEFGIGHRGSTVPERSGVALSFRGRRVYSGLMKPDTHLGENASQIEVSDNQTTALRYS